MSRTQSSQDFSQLQVDPSRMLEDLHDLRQIGAQGVGVARPAFSEADIAARKWLAERMKEAGLTPVFDAVGNLFGMPSGPGPHLLMGSHSDSQPLGGWLDGAYGVISALEIARSAIKAGVPAPAVVSFQDEEGRFGHLAGSRVWAGQISLEEADGLIDQNGVRLADMRRSIADLVSENAPTPEQFTHFIEAHIEQGAVLDTEKLKVAAVTDIVGLRSFNVDIEGRANHAGTTPMHLRRDALKAMAEILATLDVKLSAIAQPDTVWTIGRVDVMPNAQSIVPGRVVFDVQWRDASTKRLEQMEAVIRAVIDDVCQKHAVSYSLCASRPVPPTKMDETAVAAISEACEQVLPRKWRSMVSGALHDAANVSIRVPTAMLFIPSIGGISHSPDEHTVEDDLTDGLYVLADAAARIMALQ